METNQLSHQEFEDAREGLLLSLGPDAAPFELTGNELNLGPDDWAWIFLSMNEEYRDAYEVHAVDEDLDFATELAGPHILGIKRDSDGSCAEKFGLAAWLPPSLPSLPKFVNKDDSWFFPLKRPVAEDYRRQEVSTTQYMRAWTPYSSRIDTHPHILANETLFGYRPPLRVPLPDGKTASTWSIAWVAIDCSISPEGQISALANLASTMREQFRMDWPENDASDHYGVFEIAASDAFKHMHFRKAANATSKAVDFRSVWRAVQIDTLGPIVAQLQFLLKTLKEIHRDLIARKLVLAPPYGRFKNTLPAEENNDGTSQSGGNHLKTLAILAELNKWGHDARSISYITIGRNTGDRYSHNWKRLFSENIEDYIDHAKQMIHGGYRLLIHTQRPDR